VDVGFIVLFSWYSVKEGILILKHEFSNWNKRSSESINFLNNFDFKENWYRLARKKSHQQLARGSVCYRTTG
jgi:hypothetical protein